MFNTLWNRPKTDQELADSTRSLLGNSLEKMIYATTFVLFLWFFIAGQLSAQLLMWKFWVVLAITILVIRGSIWLHGKGIVAGGTFWLAGLFLINSLFLFLFGFPQAAFFFALFPLQAISILGWPAGIVSMSMVAGMMAYLNGTPYGAALAPYSAVIVACGVVSGFIGWTTADTLLSEVQKTLYFSRLASENLHEAREHRGQMFRILKDLDMAYYRLERANAALVAAWKEAENAERTKAELVTFVSHEMRTPLNLVIGFSETILLSPESYGGTPLPGPYREDLNKINQNAQHMMALVDDVIDLSRASVNRIHLTPEQVFLPDLIQETIQMIQDYIRTKKLELKVRVDPQVGALFIDRLRIRQVLLNLLVNAARFTEWGGITMEATREKGQVRINVTDTGQGISELDLPRIFDEFHSGQAPSSSWHSGSGLGLPISKKLVELHGGKMGVESVFKQGATFWFTLPDNEDSAKSPTEKVSLRPFSIAPYEPSSLERVVIVVHEDERVVPLLQRMVEGVRLLHASTVAEALQKVEENCALAVLLEQGPCQEPGQGPDQPVWPEHLLVIECQMPSAIHNARRLGVLDILEKPVLPSHLYGLVAALQPPPGKLLIVDDDVETVQLFQRTLASHLGAQNCLVAYDGREALEIIRTEKPDLVLLDLLMPEVDGYQVIEVVRSSPELKDVRIILVSGTLQEVIPSHIQGQITFSYPGGWELSKAVQSIEAVLKSTSPGWQ
jgi:signal transduction histidine kinase/CheY-like chemotaxis protein